MNRDLSTGTQSWQRSLSSASSPIWKRAIYSLSRAGMSLHARRHLVGYGRELPARWVLPGRGFGLEARRRWLHRQQSVRGRRVLVLGTGTGWDAASWISAQPAHVIGTDIFPFGAAWDGISRRFPAVTFAAADSGALPVAPGSIDVIASDAVFEHCVNLPAVLACAYAALRPRGWMYASYGPLWFSAGGDHFSGTDGLASCFSHIELPPAAYGSYVEKWRHLNTDTQSGPRYIDLNLFSKLRTAEYLRMFDIAGFDLVDLVLEVSTEAVEFRRRWPRRFAIIAAENGVDEDDLVLKTNIVLLQARDPASKQFTTTSP